MKVRKRLKMVKCNYTNQSRSWTWNLSMSKNIGCCKWSRNFDKYFIKTGDFFRFKYGTFTEQKWNSERIMIKKLNYKDGKNYCGDDGLDVKDITDWHIGGYNEDAVKRVKEILDGIITGDLFLFI